jgi:superoxide dismutase, Cu-Zn family
MQTSIHRRLAIGLAVSLAMTAGAAIAAGSAAEAKLAPTKGNNVAGTVTFSEQSGKVRVVAVVTGLAPGSHGFHVHEKGDCSAPDGTSAGGHFNPGGHAHGDPQKDPHHAGDMPMLVADASGKAEVKFDMAGVTLASGPTSLAGKAVIVHADPDDLKTQPTGNSGARVACGVITPR